MERGLRVVTRTFALVLPALIPSWRFFDVIAPSPRIEYTVLKTEQEFPKKWTELRPRPHFVSFGTMVQQMVWNPWWNENLFLASCAERLVQNPTDHSAQEILKRIRCELKQSGVETSKPSHVQFRLMFISRDGDDLQTDVVFISPVYDAAAEAQS